MAAIVRLLSNADYRLLTLVGPGGIGKTRLALQVAATLDQHDQRELRFVPLQAVATTELMIVAIADALKVPLAGTAPPQHQLLTYLHDKTLLLILDNLEQLLPDCSTVLAALLDAARGVKLLITSREVLNLQEEWLYPLHGLPYPTASETSIDPARYDAVELFTQRVRRVRPDFAPDAERASVVRICRLVEGMPLALELAAAWARTTSCASIAAEIERNLNFLATSLHNVPDQHRSVRAVFEHSWALLDQEQQHALKRLAVFRAGFRRDAAEQVTGASLLVLSALVDKSLVRWDVNGRYHLHELLRQYAAEQLGESADDVAEVQAAHCRFYTAVLAGHRAALRGGGQRQALNEIEADLENMRVAWSWAVDQRKVEQIRTSVEPLNAFYDFRGRYQEGLSAFNYALHRLHDHERTPPMLEALALLWLNVGGLYIRLGRIDEAEAAVAECQHWYQQLDGPPLPGFATDPTLLLGIIASIHGNYAETARLAHQALETSQTHNHRLNQQLAFYLLGRAAFVQGQYDLAQHHMEQAYALAQATQNRWFMAYCLSELGHVARAVGAYDQARHQYRAAFDIRNEFDDPEGMAVALSHLGEIARLKNEYPTAEHLYRQSLAIYRAIDDRGGLAAVLHGLGQVAAAQDEYEASQQHLHAALQISTHMQFLPLTLSIMASIAELVVRGERAARGVELLAFVQQHPAADQETRSRAQHLLSISGLRDHEHMVRRGQNHNLHIAIAIAQAELALPIVAITSSTPAPHLASALIESLTERELEVLHLVAAGLSNREIAQRLTVVIGTVKAHTNSIYGKLGVRNRVQAISKARELDLL